MSDIPPFGRFSDVIRKVISFIPYLKYPAYPTYPEEETSGRRDSSYVRLLLFP